MNTVFNFIIGVYVVLSTVVGNGVSALKTQYLNPQSSLSYDHAALTYPNPDVLGESTENQKIEFNIPAYFHAGINVSGNTAFDGTLSVAGNLTAPNILYALTAGTGIEVGGLDTQRPVITNTGVLSLGGKNGTLSLEAGEGITIDGLKITNNKSFTLTAGSGIGVDGETVSNSDPGSAQSIFKTISVDGQDDIVADSNTDGLTFTNGTGLSITTDPDNKKLIFTVDGSQVNVSGFSDFGNYIALTTLSDSVGIGTTTPSSKLHVVGSTILEGNTTFGASISDTITFTGQVANGTSLIPSVDLGSDLGSASKRFNNIYVGTINSNSVFSSTGQAVFTYEPTSTAYTQSSVLINPTAPPANSPLLGLGQGGNQRVSIDAEGDLTLGYAGGVSSPTNAYPLSVYGHNTTQVASIDTSGNGYFAGNVGIGTTTPRGKFDVNAGDIYMGDEANPATDYNIYGTDAGGYDRPFLRFRSNTNGNTVRLGTSSAGQSGGFLEFGANITNSILEGYQSWIIRTMAPSSYIALSTVNVERMRIDASGNVGIGTTVPTSKLHVAGAVVGKALAIFDETGNQDVLTASASGTTLLRLTRAGQLTFAADKSISLPSSGTASTAIEPGRISTGSSTGFSILNNRSTTTGLLTLSQDTAIAGLNGTTGTQTGLIVSPSFIPTSGNAKFIGINIAPTINQTSSANGDYTGLQVNMTETAATGTNKYLADFQVGGTSKYILDNAGVHTLAQTSAPGVTTDKMYNISGNLYWNGTNLTGGGALPTGTTGQTLYNNSGTWTATSNLYNNGTNVGIGTTTVGDKLTVSGGMVAMTYTASTTLGYRTHLGNTEGALWGNYSAGTQYQDRMVLSANWYKQSNGTNVTYTNKYPAALFMGARNDQTTYKPFQFMVGAAGSEPTTTAMAIEYNGNVGIGTAAPTYNLHVAGTTDNYLSYMYNTSTGTSAGGLYLRTDGSGNLLTLNSNGSDIFTVSDAQSSFNNPVSFNAPGDASFAYDINFVNPEASYIKSQAPLYITAGEPFGSSDLNFATYNKGNVVVDSEAFNVTRSASIGAQLVVGTQAPDSANIGNFYLTNDIVRGKALAIFNQTESQDIFTASASGTTRFVITNAGNIGIGTTAPSSSLEIGTGVITIPNGSVSNPSITFAGNTNTGIYRAAVNTVGIAAGGGSAALFGSTGNLTLGTWAGSGGTITFKSTSGGAGNPDRQGMNLTLASGESTGNGTGSNLIFKTSPTGTVSSSTENALQERMRIDAAGNVGIGTTAPTSKLHVAGAVVGKALAIFDETGNQDIFTASASGTTRFTITNAGNVGIGTTAPATALNVKSGNILVGDKTSGVDGGVELVDHTMVDLSTAFLNAYYNGNAFIKFFASDNATLNNWNRGLVIQSQQSNRYITLASDNIRFMGKNSTDNSYMDITSSGNVGIGTTAPTSKLHVSGAVVGKALAIFDETGNQDILTASASGSTKFVIANSGNVGIGTTTPGSTLDVNGTINSSSGYTIGNTWAGYAVASSTGLFYGTPTYNGGGSNGPIIKGNDSYFSSTGGQAFLRANSANSYASDANYLYFLPGQNATAISTTRSSAQAIFRGAYWNGSANVFADSSIYTTVTGNNAYYMNFSTAGSNRMTINQSGNIGIGTTNPGYILDVQHASDKINSKNGYLTNGADYAEYMENESWNAERITLNVGELVGLNKTNGKVRKYQKGDEFMGVVSTGIGFVGNGNKQVEQDRNFTLVGLLGQLEFNKEQTIINNGKVYAKVDGTYLGSLLNNGKILIKGSSSSLLVLDENGNVVENQTENTQQVAQKNNSNDAVTQLQEAMNTTHDTLKKMEEEKKISDQFLSDIQKEIAELKTKVGIIDPSLATVSATLAYADDVLGESTSQEASDSALTVSGVTNVYDLNVAGAGMFGLLSINGADGGLASINSLATPLKLQSLASADVEIMGGKVIIDKKGNIKVEGEVSTQKLNITNKDADSATIGEGIIKKGETQVVIKSTSITDKSKVFITATSETNSPLTVTKKAAAESFTVKVSATQSNDLKFDWWIVN